MTRQRTVADTHGYYTRILHTDITHGYYTRMLHTDITHGYYTRILHTYITHGCYTRILHTDITHGYYTHILHTEITMIDRKLVNDSQSQVYRLACTRIFYILNWSSSHLNFKTMGLRLQNSARAMLQR